MAESGCELGTSSEKAEEIALVAVDGLFAMVYKAMLGCRFRRSQLWCQLLEKDFSAIGGGKPTQRVQEDFGEALVRSLQCRAGASKEWLATRQILAVPRVENVDVKNKSGRNELAFPRPGDMLGEKLKENIFRAIAQEVRAPRRRCQARSAARDSGAMTSIESKAAFERFVPDETATLPKRPPI
jgi:hypothetical protein